MSNAVHNHWKVLHKDCDTDMLWVLLIYPHSPSGTACPWDHANISVKPIAAVLQPINVPLSYRLQTHIYISKTLKPQAQLNHTH